MAHDQWLSPSWSRSPAAAFAALLSSTVSSGGFALFASACLAKAAGGGWYAAWCTYGLLALIVMLTLSAAWFQVCIFFAVP